jgi:hypothetical protein
MDSVKRMMKLENLETKHQIRAVERKMDKILELLHHQRRGPELTNRNGGPEPGSVQASVEVRETQVTHTEEIRSTQDNQAEDSLQ